MENLEGAKFKYMYIHLDNMATKCITITTEAYNNLAALKNPNESFTEVINRITKKSSLFDLVGLLTPKEGKELEGSIKDINRRMRKGLNNIAAKLQ